MREGLPSLTAVIVASARALASNTQAAICDSGDGLALTLLPSAAARIVRVLRDAEHSAPLVPAWVARASFGLVDHLALRTRAIDAAVLEARARGIDQLVILGAGLDTRAHRLATLRGARVFEVDHPDSQARKRARAQSLHRLADELVYVPVDFARDDLAASLAAHGHAAERATAWIWEGVVPYLHASAVDATLRVIAQRSATGSELAATYVTDRLVWFRYAGPLVSRGMQVLGEPVHTLISPKEMRARLDRHGFTLRSDSDTRDWADSFRQRPTPGRLIAYERLALALRR